MQSATVQPVYAAEAEELYQRSYGGFSSHVFSTEELYRAPRGSIFTDQDVEVLGIISSFGKYTKISDWSGLYSFDPIVIEELEKAGYEWTRFYSGVHICNLKDTTLFNRLDYDEGIVIKGLVK